VTDGPGAGPALEGIRVLELSTGLAGAQCGALLALFGAEVVKLECAARPDRTRLVGPFPDGVLGPEHSATHHHLNARKQSVSLDVSVPTGRALFERLAIETDVVVDDGARGRPPAVAAVYARLCEDHPRLVIAAFSPYGLDGPKAGWASTELTDLAAGGWLTAPEPGEPPLMPGSSAPLLGVGTLGALGVVLALTARRRSGRGQVVDVAHGEALLSLLAFPTTVFAFLGRDDVRIGDRHPYGIYPCADGHLGVSILTQRHWEGLCQLMEQPDLVADPRFADGDLRALPDAVAAIDEIITAWLADRPAQPTFEAAQAMRVPVSIIPSPQQVLASAHYEARGYWHEHLDALLGPLRLPGNPFQAGPGTFAPFTPAPRYGGATAAQLDALGIDPVARRALAAAGVI
jgi:crotonobetainyl-CoA:carnitine CoA-transferase CaiB-like acyl-CoA transferase